MAAPSYYLAAVFVNFFLFYGCFSEVRKSLSSNTGRDNLIFPSIQLFDKKIRSILECVRWCAAHDACLAFSFRTGSVSHGACHGYVTHVNSTTPEAQSAEGAKTYNMDRCLCSPNPCLNGGQCSDHGDGYSCTCPPAFVGNRCQQPLDPVCGSGNHTVLDDYTRDVNYGVGQRLCDDDLNPGWYRFLLNGINAVMPTFCVERYHCGTNGAVWLDLEGASLPAVGQEITVQSYGSWNRMCRFRQLLHPLITVRNCSSFLVYELKPTVPCYYRYCNVIN